jgi:hypothetical protein
MGGKRKASPRKLAVQSEPALRAALREERRARNREYMKKWRANPEHQKIERKRRDHDYIIREQRCAERLRLHPYTGVRGQPQCGFCGLGRPVEIVERLRIAETADGEYLRVLIPYCGHC